MTATPTIRKALALMALLLAVTVSYHRAFVNDFAWDDNYIVLDNPAIQDLSGVGDLFLSPWAMGVGYELGDTQNRAYYRPLALSSMALDWALAGPDPLVFHTTNLVIHLLTSVLLFLWLTRVFRWSAGPASWLWPLGVALLYAVHPVHTEAVNLISYRTTLLSGLFGFALLWVLSVREGGLPTIALGILFFACSLLSKETGLVFVGLLGLHDLYRDRLKPGRLVRVYVPLALVGAAYLLLRSQVTGGGVYSFFEGLDGFQMALMVPRVFFLYVRLCLFPDPLCPFYDWNVLGVPTGLLEPDILAGILVMAACLAGVFLLRRRAPLASFGLAFFLVALLPVSHIVPFFDAAGERFLYVPLAGFLVALAGLAAALRSTPVLRSLGMAATALVFLGFSGLTMVRTAEWRDSETVLKATVRDFPTSLSAQMGLGRLLLEDGRPKEAVENLESVTRIAQNLAVGHGLLAVAKARSGDVRGARATLMSAPPPQARLPSAAQVARQEFIDKREARLLRAMDL